MTNYEGVLKPLFLGHSSISYAPTIMIQDSYLNHEQNKIIQIFSIVQSKYMYTVHRNTLSCAQYYSNAHRAYVHGTNKVQYQ